MRKEIGNAMADVMFNNVPVQQALDTAVANGNALLRKFEKTYQGAQLP